MKVTRPVLLCAFSAENVASIRDMVVLSWEWMGTGDVSAEKIS